MACSSTAVTPGTAQACLSTQPLVRTPTLSSGYTASLTAQAIRCDQARILAQLQGKNFCPPPQTNNRVALYASILEQDAARGCPVSGPTQAFDYPRVGVPESVRIQRVQQTAFNCSVSQVNPETRFIQYKRYDPPAPCPGPTAEQLNSTAPKPTFFSCQPSRIFDSPI